MKRIFLVLIFISLSCIALASPEDEERKYLDNYEIIVHSAKELADADVGRKDLSDPYVMVYAKVKTPDGRVLLHDVARTRVIHNNCNPEWEQVLKFSLDVRKFDTNYLYFRIVDEDKHRDKDLGIVQFWPSTNPTKTTRKLTFDSNFRSMTDNFKNPGAINGILVFTAKKHPRPFKMPQYIRKEYPFFSKDDRLEYAVVNTEVVQKELDRLVYKQSPQAGQDVLPGTKVTLYVSRYKSIVMPDVKGLPLGLAKSKIERLSLVVNNYKKVEINDPRKNNVVADQMPSPGTTDFKQKFVTLTTFEYVKPDPVDFPQIVGDSYKDAAEKLKNAGLRVLRVIKKPFDAEVGEVVETNPSREDKPQLMPGTGVMLVIAAPDKLGLTLAFPLEKKEGEIMSLDYLKYERYFIKIVADKTGYIRITDPQGNEDLPLTGKITAPDQGVIDKYSDWYDRRSFRVEPGEYFIELEWDMMNSKNDSNGVVALKYEFIPEMDEFEPNNTIYDAKYVLTGVENKMAIFPGNDVDWFCYEPEEDGYLRISLDDIPKAIHHFFMFGIYEAGSNENLHVGESLPVSLKVYAGKKYFINISVLGVDRSTETFPVIFNLIPEKDPTEPNDTIEQAYELKGSMTQRFYIIGKAEHEYFKVFPEKGAQKLTINLTHDKFEMDARVYWGKNLAEIENSKFCRPKQEPCVIPLQGEEPFYLYIYNDYQHTDSENPFTMTLSYTSSQQDLDDVEEVIPEEKIESKDNSIELAKEAYALYQSKKYEESIKVYKQAIALYEDKRYWHDMGLGYFMLKDWKNAQACFEKAIAIDDSYYLGHKSLGAVLGVQKLYERSIKETEKALALSNEDSMIYYNLAKSYEGYYIENPNAKEYLQKAFDYSSKAKEAIADNPKILSQHKRLSNKIEKNN